MKAWAALTPEQRRAARERYQTVKKLPPEKRNEVKQKWQQYQQSLAPQADTPGGEPAADKPASVPVETAPGAN